LDGTAPLPMSRCQSGDGSASLHALVTQSSRGEVAAVDLSENLILGSDRRVPGFTFVRTGELPVAIALRPEAPETTYVADFGSRDVVRLPTALFRASSGDALVGDARFPLPGAPTDMVLTPDGTALYVAIPDAGVVARIALDEAGA